MWINTKTNEVIKSPKTLVIDGITYPKQVWRDKQFLLNNGIKAYSEVIPDQRYYWQGQKVITETDTEVVCTYEKIPRLVDDRLEFNEDGTPMLDGEGKQVVTKGIKARLLDKLSNEFKSNQRPRVSTPLGFDVDGGKDDLSNFEVGKEYGLPFVKDADGVMRAVTVADYDVIISAIKANGIALFQAKWEKEQEILALATLEDVIAYENSVGEVV